MRPLLILLLLALPVGAASVDGDQAGTAPARLEVVGSDAVRPIPQAPQKDGTADAGFGDANSLEALAPVYYLNWYTVNSGGSNNSGSGPVRMGASAGEAAAGFVAGTQYDLGLGFWYGLAASCPILMTGDVNLNGAISSADIIYLVNRVFKAGPAPLPCLAAGDVNCNGAVSSADIIYLVNRVFKAGPFPCDACTSSLAAGC